MRHGDVVCGYRRGTGEMESGSTGGRRHRVRLLKFSFLFATALTAGLVAAGVVSGAGPLAVISTASTTEATPTDPGTVGETTSTEPSSAEATQTTTTEPTQTETAPPTTPTETSPTSTGTPSTSPALPAGPPTIASDEPDYAPGELVTLTGSNWQPGETVTIDVNDDKGQTWRRTVGVVATSDGRVLDRFNLPDWFIAAYAVTATGRAGVATATFTDGNVNVKTVGATDAAANVVWTRYANANCTGALVPVAGVSSGTISAGTSGNGGGIPGGVDSPNSLLLTAQPVSGHSFSSWTGDIGSPSASSPAPTGATDNPICIAGRNNTRQIQVNYTAVTTPTFNVTFGQSGIGSDTGANQVLTVGSTTYTASQLPVTLSFASGTSVSYSYSSPVNATAGKRYVLTGTTGPASPFTVTAATAVTGTYGTQFQLSLATIPSAVGAGNISGASNGDWLSSGATVNLTAATPVLFNSANSRYVFSSWSGDATGSGNPVSVTMSAPRTVTATYGTEHKLSLATNPASVGVGSLSGGSDGTFYTQGTVLSLNAATPVLFNSGNSRHVFSSWSGDATGSGNPVSVTMSAPRTVAATYGTEHKVTFDQSGIAGDSSGTIVTVGGTPFTTVPQTRFWAPGTNWSFSSQVATGSADRRYRLTSGASGTIGAAQAGTTITGTYIAQYRLTLETAPSSVGSINPSASPSSPDGFYDSGTDVNVSATGLVAIDATSRYRFDHWSGGATGTTNPVAVGMNAPKSVTANYVVQYLLTLATSPVADLGGTDNPAASPASASGFYDAGAVLNISADATVAIDAGSRWRFDEWSGDASGTTNPVSVTMSSARSVTAEYVKQFKLTLSTLPVAGIGGAGNPSASPSSASGFYDSDTSVSISADTTVAIAAGSRWRFDQWSGDASGTTNPVSVTMSSARSVTAEYVKQFQVTFGQSGIGVDTGTHTVGTIGGAAKTAAELPLTDWFDEQTSWSFEALVQTDPASGKRYNRTSAASGTITAAATITGAYVTQYRLDLATDPPAVGIANIGGAADGSWHNAGTTVNLTATTPVAINATSRYRFDHWSGGATGTTNPVAVGMNAPKTVTANYVVQYLLTFGQSGIDLETGSNTVVTVDGAPKAHGVLSFQKWYDTGASATYAYASTVFTQPASATQFTLTGVTGPSSPIVVAGPATLTGNYATNVFTIQYLRPIEQTTDGSILNTGKNGRVVPVKVELFKDGVKLTASTVPGEVTIRVVGAACSPSSATDPVEEYADAGTSNGNTNLFRWTSDSWIYNLDTSGLGLTVNKCYRLDVYIGGVGAIRASSSTYALFKPVK